MLKNWSMLKTYIDHIKKKRKTKATEAIAQGLQPLADYISKQSETSNVKEEAKKYLNDEVLSIEDAITNALYIIAENISDDATIRKWTRTFIYHFGSIATKIKKNAVDEKGIYSMYYDYKELISQIKPHRILAINRGENEKILNVSFVYDENEILKHYNNKIVHCSNNEIISLYNIAIADSFKRLIKPSIEREIWSDIFEKASDIAIEGFR